MIDGLTFYLKKNLIKIGSYKILTPGNYLSSALNNIHEAPSAKFSLCSFLIALQTLLSRFTVAKLTRFSASRHFTTSASFTL